MNAPLPIVCLARVTIETCSALSIGSGAYHPQRDCQVVRDANGLPAVPGTSIAGVLRHLVFDLVGNEEGTAELFGSIEGGPSRVEVSWAHIHDTNDKPVDRLELDERKLESDAILGAFLRSSSPLTTSGWVSTSLHIASISDKLKIVELLLDSGANPDATNDVIIFHLFVSNYT